MSFFKPMTDALFTSPALSQAATYTPAGDGAAKTVRVVVSRPDRVLGMGDLGAVAPALMCEVRVSDVETPAQGDRIEIGEDAFKVKSAVRDDERLTWRIELKATA